MVGLNMNISPAAGHIGAIVTGIDLCDLDQQSVETLRALIGEHLVLAFPDQGAMTDDEQVVFTSHFGGPYIHPLARAMGGTVFKASRIIDDVDHPPNQDKWHTDVTWDPSPPTFGCLRMVDRPDSGGDTIFVSTYAAYDALSEAMKRSLEGLTAWHNMGDETAFRSKAGYAVVDATLALAPGAEHPVIGTHPVTGRRFINVNSEFTDHIVQMNRSESDAILDFLYAHCANPNFAMRWNWTVGDVVLWDERPTLHFAVADYYPRRREVVRVNVR
jgi:taurine dioxygenase